MGDMCALQCRQPGTRAVEPVPCLVPITDACTMSGGLQCEGAKVRSATFETGAASGCKGPSRRHNPSPTTCSRVPQHRVTNAAALADPAGAPLHASGSSRLLVVRCCRPAAAQQLPVAALRRSAAAASKRSVALTAKVQMDVHRRVEGRVARVHAAAWAVGHCTGGRMGQAEVGQQGRCGLQPDC